MPLGKHKIKPVSGELAGCRETGGPNLTVIYLSDANGNRENPFVSNVQLTTSRIGSYTRFITNTHTYRERHVLFRSAR